MGSSKKFDDLLSRLGTGKWNVFLICSIAYWSMWIPMQSLSGSFLTPQLKHTCRPPPPSLLPPSPSSPPLRAYTTSPYSDTISNNVITTPFSDITTPRDITNTTTVAHNTINTHGNTTQTNTSNTTSTTSSSEVNTTDVDSCSFLDNDNPHQEPQPCTHWDFDNSTYGATLTQEFELVCEGRFLRPLYNSLYFFGTFLGAVINGWVADRYGRKTAMIIGALVYSVGSNCMCWVPDLRAILVLRFITGLCHPSVTQSGYTLIMETIQPRHRSTAGMIVFMPWCFGMMAFGGLAYILADWRWLMFTGSLPQLLFLPLLWFMDESPRWLIVRGYNDRALKVLQKIARWNNTSLPPKHQLRTLMEDIMMETSSQETKKKGSLLSQLRHVVSDFTILFRTPVIRRITLCVYVVLLASNLGYYGLSLSGDSMSNNPFVYMALGGVSEIPSSTLSIPIINRFGRKNPNTFFFVVTGFVILCLPFIPNTLRWLTMTFALVGKMTISTAYQIIYLQSTELFPTEVRTRGLGSASMFSKLGSISAPFLIDSLRVVWDPAPAVVLGGTALIAAVASSFLPETKGATLHDTITSLESTSGFTREKRGNKEEELRPWVE